MKVTMAEANLVYAAAGDDHASSTAANEHTRKALEAFLAARALSGPFVLSEREHEEVYQARLETNPELYPDSRTAILTAAIERAVRTPRSVPVPGPFVLTEQEQDDFERLFRADYDDRQRRARCRAALDRAARTLGPASGQWAEVVVDRPNAPLVLAPAEPQPDAPTHIPSLPDYWDQRRAKQQKPDKSRCAAELRIALADIPEPAQAGGEWTHDEAERLSKRMAGINSIFPGGHANLLRDALNEMFPRSALAASRVEALSASEEADVARAERSQWAPEGEVLPLLAIIRRRFAKAEQAETVVRPRAPTNKPDDAYKEGYGDGFARGVEYGRALAQLGKP
jgi:hypothetical protein